jgi:hypothetical protein
LLQTIQGNDNSLIGAACIFSSQNDKSAIAVANSDEKRICLWSLSLEELLRNSVNQIQDYLFCYIKQSIPVVLAFAVSALCRIEDSKVNTLLMLYLLMF